MARKEITWVGVILRFLGALVLVMSTYNPEGYSFVHWASNVEQGPLALKIFVGLGLVIGWTIFIRATLGSLGGFGMLLVVALFASLLWLLIEWGVIPSGSVDAISYMTLFVISALLAVGMTWSHIRRRLSGQFDIDDVED
ncbi:DUF6524 family protein [Thiohalophilus thiocyanatoxydans]|uniref:Uncharacterized protein n=1 Tax=Thiohalophilus thiocyanatoxydans TaxID=381308 RepID=A0A4R8INN3_9GAMM|nr:DUF6524 family protein [Thiohalophilus thiocyanatoxydans]TDX97771.1 hypothetical protein EDC23_2803 [Thiohalophilus thiocyanatoxydans]